MSMTLTSNIDSFPDWHPVLSVEVHWSEDSEFATTTAALRVIQALRSELIHHAHESENRMFQVSLAGVIALSLCRELARLDEVPPIGPAIWVKPGQSTLDFVHEQECRILGEPPLPPKKNPAAK